MWRRLFFILLADFKSQLDSPSGLTCPFLALPLIYAVHDSLKGNIFQNIVLGEDLKGSETYTLS